MPGQSCVNVLLKSEAEWPSLPKLDIIGEARGQWLRYKETGHAPIDHFCYPNDLARTCSKFGRRLIGYADAVQQGTQNMALLRRIDQTEGSVIPAELKIQIFSHVFNDWIFDSHWSMTRLFARENLDQAIARLLRGWEDLEDLRETALTAAREVVSYSSCYINGAWDAIAEVRLVLANHPEGDKVRNFQNQISLSSHLEDITIYLPHAHVLKFDRNHPRIKLYEDPEEARIRLSPFKSLRTVCFTLTGCHESTLESSLLRLSWRGAQDRLPHFIRTLLAILKYDSRIKVILQASVGQYILYSRNLRRADCAESVGSDLIQAVVRIWAFMKGREEYEEEMRDRVMSD